MKKRTMVIAGLLAAALALVVTGCINPTLDYGKVKIIEENAGNSAAPDTYTVIFEKNAANAIGSMDNQPYIYGVARSLSANAYSRPGYTFAGWNTQPDGSGTAYADSANIYMRPYTSAGSNTQADGSAQILNVPVQQVVIDLDDLPVSEVPIYAQWEPPEKFTNPTIVSFYLSTQSGGASADDPILLALEMAFNEMAWCITLNEIKIAGKFVDLDLSACTPSDSSTGGGLRSDGVFDPMSAISDGKNKIVNLTLPAAATGIVGGNNDNSTFKHFDALKTVSGAGVTSIGAGAFNGFSACGALTGVSFPVATEIGFEAFRFCTALTSVNFPAAATIGNGAFTFCPSLTSVSFPASAAVTENSFYGSPNVLFTLSGTGSLSTLDGGKMLIRNNNELIAYPSASGEVTLPVDITTIGRISFAYCGSLTGVNMQGVAAIIDNAFSVCGALNAFTLGATPPTIGTNILSMVDHARTITVKIPASAEAAYGVPNLPGTNFDNSSTANSWGRAFKGGGWGGGTDYRSGGVNTNITLIFEAYTPEVQQEPQDPQETVKITDVDQIAPYLNGKTGGAIGTPIDLTIRMKLTETNWKAILTAIKTANKYVNLDLSTCTPSSSSTGGGLRSRGDFDPVISFTDGKNKIVTLILPYMALGDIVGASGLPGWYDAAIPAFIHFTALKEVEGKWLTGTGDWAFKGCGELTTVNFPRVTAIGIEAFSHCGKLTAVSVTSMTDRVVSIGSRAFFACDKLENAYFPKVTSIGGEAFRYCGTLTSVDFPEVTSIDIAAFSHCGKLENVNFPKLTSINSINAFHGCEALTSVEFPKLTHIGDYAFGMCSNLVSISIPEIVYIGRFVFRGSYQLTTVTLGATPPTMGHNIFVDDHSNPGGPRQVTVNIPESAKAAYGVPGLPETNFNNSNQGNNWGNAFRGLGWDGTRYFTWWPDFAEINNNINLVFNTGMSSGPLTNPNQIVPYLNGKTGGASADLAIPLALELQLNQANWLAILSALNTAGKFVSLDLSTCTRSGSSSGGGLRSGGGFDPMNTSETGKAKIAYLTLPTVATGIVGGGYDSGRTYSAFGYFAALRTVSGTGVTSIGDWAFWACTALTNVNFPAAATIGTQAFFSCTALTSVNFPAVTTIGQTAFWDCGALTSASFPAAISISWQVFGQCNNLASVNFPKLTSMDDMVFYKCNSLATVTFGATPPRLGTDILSYIDARTVTVKIPASAKAAYGVPNLPGTNFNNNSTANSWGRAFKGTGWSGGTNYRSGTVNNNITLSFATY